jgi:hypothetical protein
MMLILKLAPFVCIIDASVGPGCINQVLFKNMMAAGVR